eukprot:TRINITY_DN18065_c0_g1_i1.p1 TRINITY_DN18065_c0_g1~~TRINITY_DN18065_c0_g1_i1.p1  ORF type:complete len:254 (+),score=60.59 TRINITY_DN18065_c0_g1_i1:201-962(+)
MFRALHAARAVPGLVARHSRHLFSAPVIQQPSSTVGWSLVPLGAMAFYGVRELHADDAPAQPAAAVDEAEWTGPRDEEGKPWHGPVDGEGKPWYGPVDADGNPSQDIGDYEDPFECPCIQELIHSPCGEQFKSAYMCFLNSEEEQKGMDCVELFMAMQDCFQLHPEIFAKYQMLNPDDDDEDDDQDDVQNVVVNSPAEQETKLDTSNPSTTTETVVADTITTEATPADETTTTTTTTTTSESGTKVDTSTSSL